MVTFVNDYLRYVQVFFMKEKLEALVKFKEFNEKVENEPGRRIQCFYMDNMGKYILKEFFNFLRQCKIYRQITCPITFQQNGVAKRKNHLLVKVYQTMIHAKNVPNKFQVESMKIVAHVINRLLQVKFRFTSLFEKLWKTKLTVSHLLVFDYVCYIFISDYLRTKFDNKVGLQFL